MASAELSHRVGKVVSYTPLVERSRLQRREFHEALLEADVFEDLPWKWSIVSARSWFAMPASRGRSGPGSQPAPLAQGRFDRRRRARPRRALARAWTPG
jgi:hypothetical protein